MFVFYAHTVSNNAKGWFGSCRLGQQVHRLAVYEYETLSDIRGAVQLNTCDPMWGAIGVAFFELDDGVMFWLPLGGTRQTGHN
jgi:hypothetical protein